MEELKNNICGRCKHFSRHYEKAYCSFYRTKLGLCDIKNTMVNEHDLCEDWSRYKSRRNINNALVLKALENALRNISVLAQIFSEESEKRN